MSPLNTHLKSMQIQTYLRRYKEYSMELILAGILLCAIVYRIENGILKATGWTDLEEHKKATIAAMTAAVLNSKGTKK